MVYTFSKGREDSEKFIHSQGESFVYLPKVYAVYSIGRHRYFTVNLSFMLGLPIERLKEIEMMKSFCLHMNLIMRTAFTSVASVLRFLIWWVLEWGERRLPATYRYSPDQTVVRKMWKICIGKLESWFIRRRFALPPQENFARCILCAMVKSADWKVSEVKKSIFFISESKLDDKTFLCSSFLPLSTPVLYFNFQSESLLN